MRKVPGKERGSMVKVACAAVLAAAAAGLLGAETAAADAKLISAVNGSPLKDAVQVFRGREIVAFDQAETDVPALTPSYGPKVRTLNLVNAGNGWLLDRQNGRIVNCYRIDSGYVGRRDIRCIAADIKAVTY
ncbi:MAG TPA: hypothetical protein VKN76_17275 [Kiloniellaceae bacterium]|nr:hypothetical protein [Kiloniellaceae bacterium]